MSLTVGVGAQHQIGLIFYQGSELRCVHLLAPPYPPVSHPHATRSQPPLH
jgi:hypothetical protein